MQLDRTAIVIAQRSADELFDLSLLVMRRYWARIVPVAILGAAPFFLLNYIFLRPITDYEQLVMASRDFVPSEGFHFRYLWTMLCLVFLQAPLAMSGVTYFLGQAVFNQETSLRQLTRVLGGRMFSLLFVIGLLRGAVLSLIFSFWLYVTPSLYPEWELVFLSILFGFAFFLVRSFRPFAPEILLLEQCPLRKKAGALSHEQSYAKRSGRLHASSGDIFSIQLAISFLALVFVVVMCAGSLFINGAVLGLWRWGWWMDVIFFPAILWLMALWETVIRFLLYLNVRIRLEGWEIYLRFKAESQRLVEAEA